MRKYQNWGILDKYNKQDGDSFYFVNYRGKESKKFSDSKRYIMKFLSNQKDIERRSRMLREISNLRSLNHFGIPKVYDTNVELFEDTSNKLFFVTELIEGTNLKDVIKNQELTFEDKLKCFVHLIDIMEYCHENGVYHQHISPNNIICRNDSIFDLALIDYGLSFNISTNEGLPRILKSMNQQFLSLPELGKYQTFHRHDPRSDITLCSGILFYMLTMQNPLYLLDHYMLKPHQRASGRIKLKEVTGVHFDMFNRIFDIAFNIDIDKRFQSFQALKMELINEFKDSEFQSQTPILDSTISHDFNVSKIETQTSNPSSTMLVQLSSYIDKIIRFICSDLGGYIVVHLKEKSINYPEYKLQQIYEFRNTVFFENIISSHINVVLDNSEILLYIKEGNHTHEIMRIPIADYQQYHSIVMYRLNSYYSKKLNIQCISNKAFV
jgi:serine/threonine protein kinase